MIDLYTAPTPNGHKASCTLEALGLEYEVFPVDIIGGGQKQPDFLKLNPNARIPVIVDRDLDNQAIFESGAIMIHLAEKTGQLLPQDARNRAEVIQWLMFQMGGLGPMMGQANVFYRYFPEKIEPVIDRYQNESRRLLEVLDKRLAESEWLARDYSIADIANWCWARTYKWSGVSIEGLGNLRRWIKAMSSQPGMAEGVAVPFSIDNLIKAEKNDQQTFIENARKTVQK